MAKCSVHGSGHAYINEGGHEYKCKCGKRIMFDTVTRRWYVLVDGQWVEDKQQ